MATPSQLQDHEPSADQYRLVDALPQYHLPSFWMLLISPSNIENIASTP